jgi:hypothetical protein
MSTTLLLLTIPTIDHKMSDDLDNLRRAIRLIEEMDAHFAKPESPSAAQGDSSPST